jgi:stalled ribosome rescue protein Dom34
MKNTGIWLDKEKAHIVTIENDEVYFLTIKSEVENYHVSGGSGTKFKGGPQDVVQDSKYSDREKQQLKTYFKTIVSHINKSNKIAVFGPAETPNKFVKELKENYKPVGAKVVNVERSDSMTDNQLKAMVHTFFKNH